MLHASIRALVFGFGGMMFLGGVVALGAGGPDAVSGGFAVLFGTGIMIAAVLQKSRYRSEAAERTDADPGRGGGEKGPMEPRFVPTSERFVDPTSGNVMRVFVDRRTGERRYLAE